VSEAIVARSSSHFVNAVIIHGGKAVEKTKQTRAEFPSWGQSKPIPGSKRLFWQAGPAVTGESQAARLASAPSRVIELLLRPSLNVSP
jgi:hypothetical protein